MSELYHHGVKGMKWGVRRYQNKDGTSKAAGKARRKKVMVSAFGSNAKGKASDAEKMARSASDIHSAISGKKKGSRKAKTSNKSAKSASKMSDAELQRRVRRLQLEKQYVDLSTQKAEAGKRDADRILDNVGTAITIGAAGVAGISAGVDLYRKLHS